MDFSSYETIQAMYDELEKEQSARLTELRDKQTKIAEINSYLNSLLSKEENDLQVFLPRKVEDVYRDVIEQNKQQRDELLSECDKLEKLIYTDEKRMVRFKKILSDTSMLHVKQLSILDVQEKERQRIARDLHDTSLQNLTHLIHKVELSSLYIDEDPVKAKLELATVEKGIRKVIEDIRSSIFDLRPMSVDDLGLKETVEKLITVLNQDKGFLVKTDIDEIIAKQDDPADLHIRFISMYRIIQECISNAIKHSGGNEIIVKLKDCDNTYLISIQDNGTGFDVSEALRKDMHFGLSVIKERVLFLGGKLKIDAKNGTFIVIEIPKEDG